MVIKTWEVWFVKEVSDSYAFVFMDQHTYRELNKYITNNQVFVLNSKYYYMDIMDYPPEYDNIRLFGIYECHIRGVENNDKKMLITKENEKWLIKREIED